jgi:hypothetical protein
MLCLLRSNVTYLRAYVRTSIRTPVRTYVMTYVRTYVPAQCARHGEIVKILKNHVLFPLPRSRMHAATLQAASSSLLRLQLDQVSLLQADPTPSIESHQFDTGCPCAFNRINSFRYRLFLRLQLNEFIFVQAASAPSIGSSHFVTGCFCAFNWIRSFCDRLLLRLQLDQFVSLQAASAPSSGSPEQDFYTLFPVPE